MENRIIRKSEAATMTGLSQATLWRLEKRDEFPRRRQLTPRSVGYLLSEILEWMEARPVSDPDNPIQGKSA